MTINDQREAKDAMILEALKMGNISVDPDTGSVFSNQRFKKTRLLLGADCNGYRVHRISFDGKKYQVRAHRIVWMAVNGKIPLGTEIDHRDRNKSNNSIHNLRAIDSSGNKTNRRCFDGEGNPNAKLTAAQVEEIRHSRIYGELYGVMARRYGVGITTIKEICKFQSWNDRQKKRLNRINGEEI